MAIVRSRASWRRPSRLRVHPGGRRLEDGRLEHPARAGAARLAGPGLLARPAGRRRGRQLRREPRPRGEYIARQDFDDRSYPDRLRLQVAFLDAHPEVGVVGGVLRAGGREPGRALRADAAHRARCDRPGHGPIHPDRQHDRDLPAAGLGRRPAATRGGQPDRLRSGSRGREAGLALRQRPRGRGRALRSRRQLFPSLVQVRRPAAEPGAGAGAGGPRAGAAEAGCTSSRWADTPTPTFPPVLKRVLRRDAR